MATQDLVCKDLQDELDELEQRVRVLEELLEDPELTPAQKGAIRQQVRETRERIVLVRARLEECLSAGISIAGVERTQATQFFFINGQGSDSAPDNSVPLISLRPLVLRVYVAHRTPPRPTPFPRPTPTFPVYVNGRVRYERTSPSFKRFPDLRPSNGPIVARPLDSLDRGDASHSLNFRVPQVDCQGVLRFTVEIFEQPPVVALSAAAASERAASFDSVTVSARFEPVPAFRVRAVLIHYTGLGLDIPAPSGLDFAGTIEYVVSTYPIARLEFADCIEQDFDGDLTAEGPGCGPGWGELFDLLGDIRAGGDPDDIYVALLPSGVPNNGVVGCGGSGGLAAAYVGAGSTLAQEIGHAFGRMHAPCGDPPNPDPSYPTYGSYPSGSIGEFGLDISESRVFDPATSEDFMSYCGPRWVSPYTYVALRNGMLERFAAAAAARIEGVMQVRELLYLKFRISRDNTVDVRPSFHRRSRPPPVSGVLTPITCEIVDGRGRVLASHRCRLRDPHQDLDDPYLEFHEAIPWSPEASSIVFRRDGEVVETVDVEDEVPTVELGKPTLAERRGTLEWSARHAERPLAYLLEFSHDDGETWRAVTSCVTESHCEIDLRRLPGGDRCRFRVLATSGIRTATAETEPFSLPREPRRAFILQPEPGHAISPGEPLLLRGGGFSPDHGLSEPQQALWTSSIDGVLGSGYEVAVPSLSEGPQTLTLTVSDGMGGVASSTVEVVVSEERPSGAQQAPGGRSASLKANGTDSSRRGP